MKNQILVLVFSLLLMLPFCSSVQIEMKSSYDLGETLVAKVSGNFAQPISEQSISFYRRHMSTSMDVSLVKLGNDYYIYAQIPSEKIPDNYSIIIRGVKYFQGTQIKDENLFYNFSITNKTADFSVDPAALIAYVDFTIAVQNNLDSSISLDISFSNETSSLGSFFSFFTGGDSKETSSFSLFSGEIKNVNFKLEELNEGLNTIKIKSENLEYLIPVNAVKPPKEKENQKFDFEESEINISLKVNSSNSEKVTIYNYGNESIKNISLSLSNSLKPYVNISKDLIKEIKSDSSEEITLTFFSKNERYLEGELEAEQEDRTRSLPIYINFTKNETYKNKTNTTKTNTTKTNTTDVSETSKTCSELGGTPCGEGLECSGTYVPAKDDKCCMGSCNKPASSSTKIIIGWSLLIISVLIFFWFLVFKYKGTKNKIDLSNPFRKR